MRKQIKYFFSRFSYSSIRYSFFFFFFFGNFVVIEDCQHSFAHPRCTNNFELKLKFNFQESSIIVAFWCRKMCDARAPEKMLNLTAHKCRITKKNMRLQRERWNVAHEAENSLKSEWEFAIKFSRARPERRRRRMTRKTGPNTNKILHHLTRSVSRAPTNESRKAKEKFWLKNLRSIANVERDTFELSSTSTDKQREYL